MNDSARRAGDALKLPPRNLLVLSFAIFLIAGAEELWLRFVPAYLEALGASILAVSLYGTLKDLLDAVYQFPGGAMTALLGTRRALLLFNGVAVLGYVVLLFAPTWWVALLALPLLMAWQSFSVPATFSMVGEALPRGERSMGFAWQSIIRRIPISVAPVIGGGLISAYGVISGVRVALTAGIAIGIVAMVLQAVAYRGLAASTLSLGETLRDVLDLDPLFKRLLFTDIVVRFGQGLGEVFIVLYAIRVVGASPAAFGWYVGIAMATSIVVYIPVARIADAHGRAPWVALTYAMFAAFPLVLGLTTDARWLPAAFVLMGLREIGEPPRKALIVDLAREGRKSVDVGAYYLVRGLAVFPASLCGGLLWWISPHLTFLAAAAVAGAATVIFQATLARALGTADPLTQRPSCR